MPDDNPHRPAIYVVALVLLALFFVAWSTSAHDCDKRHGVLVRGVVWFDCVQRQP